jgi:hypothetical protein
MLAEFLQKLIEVAHSSFTPKVIDHPKLGDEVLIATAQGFERHSVPPRPRTFQVATLKDLGAMIAAYTFGQKALFVGSSGITLLFEEATGREFAFMALRKSDHWAALERLHGARLTPRDAVKVLRQNLPSGTGTSALIRALSRVDFSRRSDGRSEVSHGKESLGKSVEASVQGTDEIPEKLHITGPVYALDELRDLTSKAVEVNVFIDVDDEVIEFTLAPDALRRAELQALIAVRDFLAQVHPEVPVYCGNPSGVQALPV